MEELPGMGGVNGNHNFILNCSEWQPLPLGPFPLGKASLRLAPMTGAIENVGYHDEKSFYFDLVRECVASNIKISIGDGEPDTKLKFGIEALFSSCVKAAVFIKPFSNEKILSRFDEAFSVAEALGVDIDAYSIVTMRGKANLEKKDASSLKELKKYCSAKGLPFIIKGVFSEKDIALVKEVLPDIAYISNHGGRVQTDKGSTASFLASNASLLRSYSGSLWVDGGIRTESDFQKAESYGVSCILLGRPFASALCQRLSFKKVLS